MYQVLGGRNNGLSEADVMCLVAYAMQSAMVTKKSHEMIPLQNALIVFDLVAHR